MKENEEREGKRRRMKGNEGEGRERRERRGEAWEGKENEGKIKRKEVDDQGGMKMKG